MKVLIFGNSGSGKSTLASSMAKENNIAHMDLDTIAWLPSMPPQRMPIEQSHKHIKLFTKQNENWVIEGCYSDLLQLVIGDASEIIFLNLPVEVCVENAKARPWEAHKYESKKAQDANLPMLIDWIRQYENRSDTFSKKAHLHLFAQFAGAKKQYTSLKDLNSINPRN